jgi:hypothetical protein
MGKFLTCLVAGLVLATLAPAAAVAAGSHDFCIKRTGARTEVLHARVNFPELDPGREIARFLAEQRFRRLTDTAVTATDYRRGACRGNIQEFSLALSAEDIRGVAIALGNGDVEGAGRDAASLLVGTIVTIVDPDGQLVGGVQQLLCNFMEC